MLMSMSKKIYITKIKKLPGTNYAEVYKKAFGLYQEIKRKSKRRPYVRSKYFGKEKIFLERFWLHFHQKNWRDRARRVPYFACAIDLIRYANNQPESKEHPTDRSQILHRFTGICDDGSVFRVQIKEDKRNKQKWLMSVYPAEIRR